MSTIARAFTTRRVKLSTDLAAAAKESPQRSNTTKGSSKSGIPIARPKISGPVELTHTTNMLSYNAPDIVTRKPTSPLSSSSSTRSLDDDTDSGASSPATAMSSPPTSPDMSPRDKHERPMSTSPEPNHLSCYFTAPGQPKATPASPTEAPAIPKRAPSHTKKASYDAIARSRSNSALTSRLSNQTVSTKASFTFSSGSRASSASTVASSTSHNSMNFGAKPPVPTLSRTPSQSTLQSKLDGSRESHPFGLELAQVSEIAEDYGVTENLKVIDEEEKELAAQGLQKFSAEDYLTEIQNLINSFFVDPPPARHTRPVAAMWI